MEQKRIQEQVDRVVSRHGTDREALVEILRELNQEAKYLTREHIEEIADQLDIPAGQAYSVASFYSLINLEPVGEHVVRLCEDAPCHVAGGSEVWETLEQELGVSFGETTSDGKWTLLPTSCIGACSVGPVMMIDDEIYGNLTPQKVRDILARYRNGENPGGDL